MSWWIVTVALVLLQAWITLGALRRLRDRQSDVEELLRDIAVAEEALRVAEDALDIAAEEFAASPRKPIF